jgi:Transglycosylase SLT domain
MSIRNKSVPYPDNVCRFAAMILANFVESLMPRIMILCRSNYLYVLKFLLFTGITLAVPNSLLAQVYEIGTHSNTMLKPTLTQPVTGNERSRIEGKGDAVYSPLVTRKIMPPNWKIIVTTISEQHAIDPVLFEALIWQESRWNPSARSPKGAIGLTQLMPGTAQQLGVNPFDIVANLDGGARYLKSMLTKFKGDTRLALAAYNSGPARVVQYQGVPPFAETRRYVDVIHQRVAWGGALEE